MVTRTNELSHDGPTKQMTTQTTNQHDMTYDRQPNYQP